MKTTILVTGSRDWVDRGIIKQALKLYADHEVVVLHGACRGADTIADRHAKALGYTVKRFKANWAKYGKAAGPYRNQAMVNRRPDIVLAFHPDLAQSKGTKDCVDKALEAGIPTYLCRGMHWWERLLKEDEEVVL